MLSRIPLPALVAWCRALRVSLSAGLSPVKVLRTQAKSGPAAVRTLAASLSESMKAGESFADALKPHRTKFPLLFLELVAVGEKAGKLAEVFEELERYFESQQDARKQFLSAMMMPAVTYIGAVLVVAIMLLVLGLIGGAFAPFGKFLIGPTGAAVVLLVGFGFAGVLAFLYFMGRDNDDLKRTVEAAGLNVPGVGLAFKSFALHRFSLALSITHEAGMRADEALHSSFQATANNAYLKHATPTASSVKRGTKIAKALAGVGSGLFPDEFLNQVSLGETSGQITEVMGRAAEQYREEAIARTKTLARVAGGLVYALVGLMVIAFIIGIVMSIAGVYKQALDGI